MWPLIVIFSPLVLLAGEPVNRYVMRRAHRAARMTEVTVVSDGDGDRQPLAVVFGRQPPHVWLLFMAMRNPLWIALTAPGRWVSDRFRRTSRR
jgi:hypothetical protein